LFVFPEEKPEITGYFKSGQLFYSKQEGVRQTIVKQENGYVYCSSLFEPFAPGPPKHIHLDFDEYFEIENGELSVWIDGEVKKIKPGERIHIPKGMPHQPYNETADTIRMAGSIAFPEAFTFSLIQIYGLLDDNPDFGALPKTLFMLAPIHQGGGFDAYMAEGPPVVLQKFTSFFLTPIARLMGYRSYYEKYSISERK